MLGQKSSSELGKNALGHKIFTVGLEVDQAKVVVIKTLMPPTTVKGIKSFLRHAVFT